MPNPFATVAGARSPRRRSASRVGRLALALLLATGAAAGCGSDDAARTSSTDHGATSSKRRDAPELGVRQNAICTVYGHEVASDDVEDLAGFYAAVLESRHMVEDAANVESRDGEEAGAGKLEPLEAVALHPLVEAAIVDHAAEKADVEPISEDQALEAFARDAFDAGADQGEAILQEAEDEAPGIRDEVLRMTGTTQTLAAVARDRHLDEEDTAGLLDDLLGDAEERDEVVCGDDVDYFETSGAAVDEHDREVRPQDAIGEVLVEAAKTVDEGGAGGTEDPVDSHLVDPASRNFEAQGTRYEDQVVPIIKDFVPLVNRLASVITKLDAGTISLRSTADGFRKQSSFAASLERRTNAVKVEDPYLVRANTHLAAGYSAYADALAAMGSLDTATSESRVNAILATADRDLKAMDRQFTAWQSALDADPHGRAFARAAAAAAQVETTASSLQL